MTLAVSIDLSRGDFRLSSRFEAPGRGVTAVFGRSGSGKTSLVRCLAGLEEPTGRISVGEVVWLDGDRRVPAHLRGTGCVFQDPRLFTHLSVSDNLAFGYRRAPHDRQVLGFDDVVAMLEIGHLLERRPATLSGGERQRVAIGRALLSGPTLMLLDEPLAALDDQARGEILGVLDRVFAALDVPVVYVTHALDEVARLADTMLLLEDGAVTAFGPVGHMLTRLDLPLALTDDAEALIEATVDEHDTDYGLTSLRFEGGAVTVPAIDAEPDVRVRLRIKARDVSLTLEPQVDTSILNILPATVTGIAMQGDAQVIVQLDAGGSMLLAQLTRRSADALGIADGRRVYAQAKSIAVLV